MYSDRALEEESSFDDVVDRNEKYIHDAQFICVFHISNAKEGQIESRVTCNKGFDRSGTVLLP